MNSDNTERELKTKLDKLEAEINQQQPANEPKVEIVNTDIKTDSEAESQLISNVYGWLSTARDKFNSLSGGGKLVVGIAAIWLGFTALNFALHLLTNVVVIGILGLVLYFAYQKLVPNRQ